MNGRYQAALRASVEVAREPAVSHGCGCGGGTRSGPVRADDRGVVGVYSGGALEELGDSAQCGPFGYAS